MRTIPAFRQLHVGALLGAIWAVAILPIGCGAGDQRSPEPGEAEPAFSLLAVGDTGRHRWPAGLLEGQLAVARGMALESERSPVDAVVLLGDNFYWDGLTQAGLIQQLQRNLARPYCPFLALDGPRAHELGSACVRESDSAVPIRFFAVLGNHDLRSPESPRLQREEIPKFASNWTMAQDRVEVFVLAEGISLILFESELHLSEARADAELSAAIRSAPGPWRIVAAHRPMIMGERGARPEGGFPVNVQRAIARAEVPVHLYLSGHEHNLQLLVAEPPSPSLHVIVGSGARSLPLVGPELPGRRYGENRLGFARIDLVGEESSQRLLVSLFSTPSYPIFMWQRPERVARWSVSLDGKTRDESAGTDSPADSR